MSLRVVQWATGSVGVAAIKGILEHPELELAGCWVHSEAKHGKDVGDIVSWSPLGVTATNNVDEILALAADPQIRSSQEVAVATEPIDSPIGVIEPGQVAGRRFHWEAFVGDAAVVRITVNWLMGEENLDPPWSFGPAGERYEIELRGNPD